MLDLTVREFGRRYGPLIGFLAVALLAALLVPATHDKRSPTSAARARVGARSGDTATTALAGTEAASPGGVAPASGGQASGSASSAGGGNTSLTSLPVGSHAAAPATCRKEDGRQPGISRYMPPCVEVFRGDNGGATAKGVQRNKVIVVRYVNYGDAATRAAAAAVSTKIVPSQADWERETAALMRYFNLHYETYGREVVAVTVEASGTDDKSARADAIKIAEEIGAFAVFPGTGGADVPAFVEELAARHVFCMGCTLGYSRSFYRRTKGYVFATAPPVEEMYAHVAEYIGKRLAGKPARWAGDQTLAQRQRKFGMLWINNTFPGGGAPEPGQKQARDFLVAELGRYGVPLARDVGYSYDISRAQEQATNVIVQMKTANVTTLAWHGDPFSLIVFTREATRQAYFPEWLIVGGFASDSTIFGRLYDQAQWRHAFGVTSGWVFPTSEAGAPGYREYHHARPAAPASEGNKATVVLHPTLELLFTGFQMAGPRLTIDTFQNGMYAYPETGGLIVAPLRYFRPDSPMALKDAVEIFYDAGRSGADEVGNQGVGVQVFAESGKRRTLGSWPRTDPKVFTRENTIVTTDDPPAGLPHEQNGHTHPADQRCRSC